MVIIFALQTVDRSFGPILPLYVAQIGVPDARVPTIAGILFSIVGVLRGAGPQGRARRDRAIRTAHGW